VRSLSKLPEPQVLSKNKAAWTASYLEALNSHKKPGSPWGHEDIRAALKLETQDRCAYCDAHVIHVAQPHVEHFRPRAKYPRLAVDWQNLTIACPRCNREKSDKFNEELPFIYPFDDKPQDHFIFYGNLIFAPVSDRGAHTITELGLNNLDLVHARARRLETLALLVTSWIRTKGVLKDGILAEIHKNVIAGEFRASAYAFLMAFSVPLPR
jgi:uncharacterized protein (TIGR02646 family)